MRGVLGALVALPLATPAAAQYAAQDKPAWVGVWEGTVGNAPVRMCLGVRSEHYRMGAYYYTAYLEPIQLAHEPDEGGWIERGPGYEVQAHWDFAELSATRARGTWRQGGRRVPFSLTPVAWTADQWAGPCTSAAFLLPRLAGGTMVDEPGRIPGLGYTVHRYVPAAHFADDLAVRNFSFAPRQPGDAAIVREISLLVPMPGESVDDEAWQCIAHGIAANGTDGSWDQSVEPTMAVGPYLTMRVSSGTYCGGAHPDDYTYFLTYDRTTGQEIDVDDWIGTPNADGAVAMPPALRALILRRWPAGADFAECREAAAATTHWSVELRQTGLSFTPPFPRVIQACAESTLVEWPDLAPFLDAEGRAGLARLRGE